MLAYGLASAGVWALTLLVAYKLPACGPLSDCASQCPHNPLALVGPSEAWARITSALVNGVTAAGVAWVAGLLIRRAGRPLHCAAGRLPLCWSLFSSSRSHISSTAS
jgi:hypothetical protein